MGWWEDALNTANSAWGGIGRKVVDAGIKSMPFVGNAYQATQAVDWAKNSSNPMLSSAGKAADTAISYTPLRQTQTLNNMLNGTVSPGDALADMVKTGFAGGVGAATGGVAGSLGATAAAAATNPGPAGSPGSPGQPGNPGGYDAERLALDRERHNAAMASIGRIQGIANPYDTNSEAWKKSLAQALNTQTRNFAGSEARIQGDLAGRGMLGSGYESAALGGLGARRAQALSDTENQMYADALRGSASFDLGREQAILSGLGAQNNLGATLADLARTQREQDSAFWNGAGNLGATILQNWDKLAGLAQQFGLGSPQAVEQAVKSGTAPAALMDVIQGGTA